MKEMDVVEEPGSAFVGFDAGAGGEQGAGSVLFFCCGVFCTAGPAWPRAGGSA